MPHGSALLMLTLLLSACSSDGAPSPGDEARDASVADAAQLADGGAPGLDAASADAAPVDLRPATSLDRFATRVVSFVPGPCAGFGADRMPNTVLGPPEGGGTLQGGLDVLSLGTGGTIVLSFEANPIVNGPGPDLLVFENPFYRGGDPADAFVEPAEVSVSDDGASWKVFACDAAKAPFAGCAGIAPVLSASTNTRPATDPAQAGGDAFDLETTGLTRARFVRIVDRTHEACGAGGRTNGFDLDAVASVHAERP
ncbi:MAG: cell surface protein [Polyangiaceae bacterium]|nr:cell surface protein [Polyangiaceae bacterium]